MTVTLAIRFLNFVLQCGSGPEQTNGKLERAAGASF
jgi:hypothetical protein